MSAIPDTAALLKQGVSLPELPDHLRLSNFPVMGAISIRAGLIAYFSTYRIVGVSKVRPQRPGQLPKDDKIFEQEGRRDYLESYTETILHLHYSIELALKEILRQKHTLLAAERLPQNAVLLCRLLNKESISPEEEGDLKSATFAEALERVIALAKAKLLDSDLSFDANQKTLLQGLNTLRNKIIHRGMFVMDYSAFDIFVASKIIPFLAEFLNLPQFQNRHCQRVSAHISPSWKYNKLACGIDPLEEIAKITNGSKTTRRKLAFLKELGRAAFHNPLPAPESNSAVFGIDGPIFKSRAEQLAKHELSNPCRHSYQAANKILECPVCGLSTLVRYHDGDGNDTEVICMCCTFKVDRALGNAHEYGLPIKDDFWPPANG